jgi:putative nucleotidyltransferase with HDIG domain
MMDQLSLLPLSPELVITRSRSLPSFPGVVVEILNTLDDPDGNLDVLVKAIKHDPLISARVISVANTVAMRGTRTSPVDNISMATSLIGMNRVRHIALISSLSTFVDGAARLGLPASYWQHSVAVGICCEELAMHSTADIAPGMALMAGLMHDIGQLWLHQFEPVAARYCRDMARARMVNIEQLEEEKFGVGHGQIGAWLLDHWSLPEMVVDAVLAHHQGAPVEGNPLVALVHVGEVISNALNLTGRAENRVNNLSKAACEELGLLWDDSSRQLFGRIESRAWHESYAFIEPPT